jgi:hypothetical protein
MKMADANRSPLKITTPKGSIERDNYFNHQAISISKLGEYEDINGLILTYVKNNVSKIREEYKMLEAMHKELKEKGLCNTNDNISNEIDLIYLKQIHSYGNPNNLNQYKLNPTNKCSNFYEYAPKNRINIDKNINILTPSYILPHFSINQPKELFLTEIFEITVAYHSRIVILFDAPDDWNNIIAQNELTQKDIDTKKCTNNDNYNNINTDSNTNRSSDNYKIFESDITMAVESEETDEKNETVVTWLRLQIDKKKGIDNESCNNDHNSSQHDRNCKSKISTGLLKHEKEEFEPSLNIITDTDTRMGDEAVYGYRVALIRCRIYVHIHKYIYIYIYRHMYTYIYIYINTYIQYKLYV